MLDMGGAQTRGSDAERLVVERVQSVVDPGVAVIPNVQWLRRTPHGERHGEADVVIGDPERGILVLEVKSGQVRRDDHGTWWVGGHPLDRPPFRQASDNRYALLGKLAELPDWPPGFDPIAGEAVAFPDVDLDTMRGRLGLMGLDAEQDLIADQSMFRDDEDGRVELRAFLARAFDLWGSGRSAPPPGPKVIALLESTFREPLEFRSQLRNELVEAEAETTRMTDSQAWVMRAMRANHRMEVRGGAGTGKTLMAIDAACRFAGEGFETLLVCFNSPLARMLAEATSSVAANTGRLTVATFHQLCEDLGREAGTLPPKPANPVPPEWFNETLPAALDAAIAAMHGGRYHAIVVDEGQDFDANWLLSLDELLTVPGQDALYVFHDPAQSIYREDSVAQLGLAHEFELDRNCRNAQPIHAVVERFAQGGLASTALRTEGRAPDLVEVDGDAATLRALGQALHRLRAIDGEPTTRPFGA